MIELRDTTQAEFATEATIINRQAGFILKDGSIVQTDGFSNLQFNNSINHQLFLVIRHRNHLSILSANPLQYNKGVYNYDFATGPDEVFNGTAGYKQLSEDIWGMAAGDSDGNGLIGLPDKDDGWEIQAGESGYYSGDFNLDVQVDNIDKDDYWLPNVGKGAQVPD